MNVSFTYLSYIDGFNDVGSNTISLKYSMYTLANTEDNSDAVTSSSGWYMPDIISN